MTNEFPSAFDLVASMQDRTEGLLRQVKSLTARVKFEAEHKNRWIRVAENRAKKITQLKEKLKAIGRITRARAT